MSKTDYHIRLAFRVSSESPGDAVQDMIDILVERGLRDHVYVVDDIRTERRVGFFNGYGEQIDDETVRAAADAVRQADEAELTPEPDTVEANESDSPDPEHPANATPDDDELEQLADMLNNEQ